MLIFQGRVVKMGSWDEISKDSTVIASIKSPQEENPEEDVKPEEIELVIRKRLQSSVSVMVSSKFKV